MPLPNPSWNDTCRDYPAGVCLHQLFVEQALRTPTNVALVCGDKSLTYEQLLKTSQTLAAHLQALGIGANDLVGICLDRSPNLLVSLLATLQAGAAYVPLDPSYPKQRLLKIIEDANPSIVLTDQNATREQRFLLEDTLTSPTDQNSQPSALQVLFVDDCNLAGDRHELNPQLAREDDLAYVIYTSGTTGMPKGAMNSHRGICNRLFWMQEEYALNDDDVVLQKTAISFDVSVWELFWPLITGARLVLARPGGHMDSHYLCEVIQAHGVSVMHFVPSMLRVFLEEPRLDRCRSLRDVICSGETLTADLQRAFFAKLDANLHNLYGPTEAAIDVTYWKCERESTSAVVPIGRSVANTQIHILNEALESVEIGAAGELHIGGVQVALGYLNRPQLTAERFIDDPFSERPNAKLYKTGDLARYREDGVIEFLGRIDTQVKIRGFRIELGEIESVLGEHPTVRQAVVTAADYGAGDKRLIAYLLLHAPPMADVMHTLREHVAARLPEYMVPAMFVEVKEIPLSANGKVDRKSLAAPPAQVRRSQSAATTPRTPLQRRLAGLWSDVLKLENIGIHDRFFELGGNSLLAATFVNRLQAALGEFIYIVTIFDAPTVAEYAEMLLRDYPDAVRHWLGPDAIDGDRAAAANTDQTVTERTLQSFRNCVPQFVSSLPLRSVSGAKNPRAIFILAPPRSGTTLLRVMLAGHSQLFAAPELQLLNFNSLAERKGALIGKFAAWQEGAVRAIMQLQNCDARKAKEIIHQREQLDQTTKQFYAELQDWVVTQAGKRLLIDKSPHYALDPAALQKSIADFERPFFIHLTRHPRASVQSFQRQHMDQILFLEPHEFGPRAMAELTWTQSHLNILEFLRALPTSQHFRLSFEELVEQPAPIMRALCAALELPFEESLISPYDDLDQKMVDGIHPESQPMGDQKFFRYGEIRESVGRVPSPGQLQTPLGNPTCEVAERLGYAMPQRASHSDMTEAKSRSGQNRSRRMRRLAARKDSSG